MSLCLREISSWTKNSWLKLKPGKMEKKEVIQAFSKTILMLSSPSHRERNTGGPGLILRLSLC